MKELNELWSAGIHEYHRGKRKGSLRGVFGGLTIGALISAGLATWVQTETNSLFWAGLCLLIPGIMCMVVMVKGEEESMEKLTTLQLKHGLVGMREHGMAVAGFRYAILGIGIFMAIAGILCCAGFPEETWDAVLIVLTALGGVSALLAVVFLASD